MALRSSPMGIETGQKVGPWTLHDRLGNGGNATVWKATRSDRQDAVALKVLHTKRVNREPYQRFVREIEFLQSLRDTTGVLPLIDASLPEVPTNEERPWLAMPIATPITDALHSRPLEDVVAALAEIASTLARLSEEHHIGHRDIKPGNLYERDGQWLVGDFGLIAISDRGELTRTGRPVGPTHYAAYEMIRDPSNADPLPADVYSLGKTLWVLATEQRFPPEGHQVADTRQFSIADMRPHPHAATLDQLIDRATRIHPDQRPTMVEVARDLKAWGTLSIEPVNLDVSRLRAQLLERMAGELAAEDLREHRKDLALIAVRRLNELFAPLNSALRNLHPRAQIDIAPDRGTQSALSTPSHHGSPKIEFKYQRMSQVTSGPEHDLFALRVGRSLELTDEGELIFRSYVSVGRPGIIGGGRFSWYGDEQTAPVGSVQAEVMLQKAISELGVKLSEGLKVFVEDLPRLN